ncbi:conserved phage C-terminal domain-containing protein [Lactococcus garvieae]|uniref:conserved phage C-terminal domain-containing protein n=1 Tax=Lactococcus garvieae TaxID=1363 RepID=UPI003132C21F
MAQRRMFSKKIVETDFFMEMSPTAKLLYFYLNMSADDDGFVGNPKTIKLISGATDDDLKILIAKQFIIPFDSGVIVIKDWKIHNYIRKDTYNHTVYSGEKSMLETNENGSYVLKNNFPSTERPRKVDTGKDRLGKDRLGKDNNMSDKSDDVIPYSEIISYLNEKANRGFKNVDANKRLIKARWKEGYKLEDFQKVIDNKVLDWTGKTINGQPAEKYLQPSTLFGTKFDNYLNEKPVNKGQGVFADPNAKFDVNDRGGW